MKKCKSKDCINDTITFSDYCGLHSSKRKIRSILNKLELGGNYNNIKLSRIAPKNGYFDSLNINEFQITDAFFTSFHIKNSNFGELSDFSKSSFDEVIIENCSFQGVVFEDVNFTGVEIINCKFSDCNFNQCHFTYEGSILNSIFEKCKFSGCFIDDNKIENSKFILGEFLICSFEECKFLLSNFQDIEFSSTNIYNNELTDVHFLRIEHDFNSSSYIRLCIFNNCTFLDFRLPEDFKFSNSTEEPPLIFYKRIVDQYTDKPDINFLNVLNAALFRIGKIDDKELMPLRTNFFKIYQNLLEKVKEKRDYILFSKLIENFAISPDKIKDTDRLFLPPPVQSEISESEANIKIYINVDDWDINSISKVQLKLATISNSLPQSKSPIRVERIEKGSLIEILSGELLPITVFFYFLYKYGIKGVISDFADVYLKLQTIGVKKLENQERRLKIKELEAKLNIQDKSDKLNLQKLENEVKKQELDIIDKFLQLKKFSVENYGNTQEGRDIIKAIEELNQENKILDLKLLLPEKVEST